MKLLTNEYARDMRGPDKTRLILGLKTAAFLAAVLVVFGKDLAIVVVDAVQNESATYMLAIPFLFAYLIYRKRKMLRTVMPLESQAQSGVMRHSGTIVGALLTATAILLYWYGSYGSSTSLEYHMLTLPIFAAGLTLILFNTQTLRELAFPLAFLILLTPPSEVLSSVGPAFSVISSEASYAFVRFVGISATLTSGSGNPVIQVTRSGGETIGFAVSTASSGIYSLLGFLVFAVFTCYIIRTKPWKKLAFLLIGSLIIYVLSIARIATILLLGYGFGKDLATEVFLMLGGWILIFLGTLLLLAFSEKVLHTRIFPRPSQECPECSKQPKADRSFCFSCGRILRPTPAKFQRTDLVKIVAIIAVLILLMWPIASWPQATLFLSQRILYLAATTCALFPVVTILFAIGRRTQRKIDVRFYQKLSMQNRQVIESVSETEKNTMPTLQAIAVVFGKKTGESIEAEEMLRMLVRAERTGIIEAHVANVQDEPTQVWRSQLNLSKVTDEHV